MKRLFGILAFLLVLAGLGVLGIGSAMPDSHVVACQVFIRLPLYDVWHAVNEFDRWAEWHPEVRGIAPSGEKDGHPVWTLQTRHGPLPMEIARSERGELLETLVETKNVRSSWVWTFAEYQNGMHLTITQTKSISNPFLRGLDVFFDDHEPILRTMKGLGRHLGFEVYPEEKAVRRGR